MDERYSRQELFLPIGAAGQEKLMSSRVLLVGCGALGASHAEMLTRAGVGHIRIVDRDFVEYTNLQRQMLFDERDADERTPKAIAARERLSKINSAVTIDPIVADVNNSNVESLIEGCDLVLDGTDNFQIRYLVNDACVKQKKPWIYGSAVSSQGTTMTIIPGETPCLRCVFPEMPGPGIAPTCDTAGVIMPIITSISAVQIAEALKILVCDTQSLHGSLMQIDIWQNEWRKIKAGERDPNCLACGQDIFEFLDADSAEFSAILCGRDAVQIAPQKAGKLDLDNLAQRIRSITNVKQNEYLIRFRVDEYEITVFGDGRAIIRGTDDISAARSVYAKYIGL